MNASAQPTVLQLIRRLRSELEPYSHDKYVPHKGNKTPEEPLNEPPWSDCVRGVLYAFRDYANGHLDINDAAPAVRREKPVTTDEETDGKKKGDDNYNATALESIEDDIFAAAEAFGLADNDYLLRLHTHNDASANISSADVAAYQREAEALNKENKDLETTQQNLNDALRAVRALSASLRAEKAPSQSLRDALGLKETEAEVTAAVEVSDAELTLDSECPPRILRLPPTSDGKPPGPA